jgi:hypothetical protein
MSIRNLILFAFVSVVLGLMIVSCWQARPGLDEYCPSHPIGETCPEPGGCRLYECLSYCIRNDLLDDGNPVPLSGMGSWCSGLTTDEDVRTVCCEHPEVDGCPSLADLGCEGSDGDGDSDSDSDSASDGDAEGDTEEPGCTINDECPDPLLPRCDTAEETCVGCLTDGDCTTHDALGRCHRPSGACVACLVDGDCENTVAEVRVCNTTTHACVTGCQNCATTTPCAEPGFRCVSYLVPADTGTPLSQCFQPPTSDSPDCERPYRKANVQTIGESAELIDLCLPPTTTSCVAMRRLGENCEGAEMDVCSDPEFETSSFDGLCMWSESEESFVCTYHCEGPEHCPEGSYCDINRGWCFFGEAPP